MRRVYRYFLLPLEAIVPSKALDPRQARQVLEQARFLELMEAKVRNHGGIDRPAGNREVWALGFYITSSLYRWLLTEIHNSCIAQSLLLFCMATVSWLRMFVM